MSSKPVGFQDITSNVLGYTINTSTAQCRLVERQIADLPQATQDEIYGRFYAVNNHLEKDAAKGRKYLYTSLDYAGLSQQLGKVATDIQTCIGLLQLSAQNASWTSSCSALSDFAKKEIEAHGSQRQAAIAAYVDKLDPLPPATPANAASPSSADVLQEVPVTKKLKEAACVFALHFLSDYKILQQNEGFFKSVALYDQDQEKVLEIFDSLSPFAQLIIEQNLIDHNHGLSKKADTMRAAITETRPNWVKDAMISLFNQFNENLIGSSIIKATSLDNLSKTERRMVKAYLDFPRFATLPFLKLQSHTLNFLQPDSSEALSRFISNQIDTSNPQTFQEFQTLVSELELLEKEYSEQFRRNHAARLKNSTLREASQELQLFSMKSLIFTKKDFLAKIMLSPEHAAAEVLQRPTKGKVAEAILKALASSSTHVKDSLFKGLSQIKNDIDLANQHMNLIKSLTQAQEQQLREVYSQFSFPARCMIEKIRLAMLSKLTPAEGLQQACFIFFFNYLNSPCNGEFYSKQWMLEEDEAIYTQFYFKGFQDFRNLLPIFTDRRRAVSIEDFTKQFNAMYPKIPENTLKYYEQRGLELLKLIERKSAKDMEKDYELKYGGKPSATNTKQE